MALLHRLRNMAAYSSFARLKAAFGLLSDDERHRWIETINAPKPSRISLENVYPWYAFGAIDYIGELINRNMEVLEFGGGYSTLYWASRVRHVSTIERSQNWCREIGSALCRHNLNNVNLICFDKFQFLGGEVLNEDKSAELEPLVREYIYSANVMANSLDVVVIDDVFRNAVTRQSLQFVKPGGIIILDDSEIEEYRTTVDMLNGLKYSSASFYGAAPFHFHEKQTSIWIKSA
ncbi:MAG TPA: hypothetical protein VN316_01600 [candidate division Zixibacteria bacterium]|nr:hypothetical protein [candidate division Zixibacteria bacterium]